MKISCIIIDDEPCALKLMEDHIAGIPFLELKGCFFDGLEAIEFLKERQVDVIFTDITMPIISGLQLAEAMPAGQRFVFTTAHEEYAVKSFRYHVVDYLVKPVTPERFNITAEKLKTLQQPSESAGADTSYLFVKSGGHIHKIFLNDVHVIRGEKEYVGIHFKDRRLLVYKRMKEMEQLLPAHFKRVHLSFIVNINHLDKIAANYVMAAGEQIPIGLSYRQSFQEFISRQLI
jgi:DNA-binding LytR/AlgR family response regulator